MKNQAELETRIDNFIILEQNHLSIYMSLHLMKGLARAYDQSLKSIIKIWDRRKANIDLELSSVPFHVVYKQEGEKNESNN